MERKVRKMSKNLQLANKEPLFHMVKRDTISIKKAWGIRKMDPI